MDASNRWVVRGYGGVGSAGGMEANRGSTNREQVLLTIGHFKSVALRLLLVAIPVVI